MSDGNPTRKGRRDPRRSAETAPNRTGRKPRRPIRDGGQDPGRGPRGRAPDGDGAADEPSFDALLEGMARARGGWWDGEAPGRAASDLEDHEAHYREHFAAGDRGDLAWDEALPAYVLGHVAGRAPRDRGRRFQDVEGALKAGCEGHGRSWEELRPFVRAGYLRTSTSV